METGTIVGLPLLSFLIFTFLNPDNRQAYEQVETAEASMIYLFAFHLTRPSITHLPIQILIQAQCVFKNHFHHCKSVKR